MKQKIKSQKFGFPKMIIAKTKPVAILETEEEIVLPTSVINRHGLVTGATGSGKSISLRVLAENFSDAGIPVFLADVKGDLKNISECGQKNRIDKKLKYLSIDHFECSAFPVKKWDMLGKDGEKIQTTVSGLSPMFIARMLDLSPAQTGVCSIAFDLANDKGRTINTLDDLLDLLRFIGSEAYDENTYGFAARATIGTIQRGIMEVKRQGADNFFGPAKFKISDFIKKDGEKGVINLLAADKLIQSPRMYATFVLWLLSELYDNLPEVGNLKKPKFVYFIDEAHLLFRGIQKNLLERIEQMIRLIRSKGVGVWFVSQSPSDIPSEILGQLGNKIQHMLMPLSAKGFSTLKALKQTFANPMLGNIEYEITNLETGQAIISFLNEAGRPSLAKKAYILPPRSKFI